MNTANQRFHSASGSARRFRSGASILFPALLSWALSAALLALSASAALAPKKTGASLEEATNPRPAAGDILLPMPCNAAMAFRPVAVQAEGFLWDMETLFGCDNCDRQERDYYERRYSSSVSGPFSARDLPKSWQDKLPRTSVGQNFYYLIGKYEISVFQWRAVMDGWCPTASAPLQADDVKPKTGISWFEALEFSRKYTEWLLKNAPDSLPRFAGDAKNIGYLRLPTEAEWEYAARGGQNVPRASLREQEFFPLAEGAVHADYAVFRAEKGRAAEGLEAVGKRRPNPLGLHDTAGNAAEMVMDTFHFSLGGRLHGSAGGFIRKGGSYASGLSEIMPGRREEAAFFLADGANSSRDMGARLALSGINTPGGDRPKELEREWKSAGEQAGPLLDKGKNPLEEIDRIIAQTANTQERENLSRVRGILKDNNIALERQRDAAAEGLIRSALFMIETVRNYGVRHKNMLNIIADARAERDKARKMNPRLQAEVEETLKSFQANLQELVRSMDGAVAFYRSKVEESLQYPEALFSDKLTLVRSELKGDDLLSENMRKAEALYARHVALMRQGKRSQLTRDAMLDDILPENLREGLFNRR